MKVIRLDKRFYGLRWNGDAHTVYFDEEGSVKIVNITAMEEVEGGSEDYGEILQVVNNARENGEV